MLESWVRLVPVTLSYNSKTPEITFKKPVGFPKHLQSYYSCFSCSPLWSKIFGDSGEAVVELWWRFNVDCFQRCLFTVGCYCHVIIVVIMGCCYQNLSDWCIQSVLTNWCAAVGVSWTLAVGADSALPTLWIGYGLSPPKLTWRPGPRYGGVGEVVPLRGVRAFKRD